MSVTEVATVPEVEARDEMPVFKIDQGALALRKKERDMAKEMDKIREDITLVFGQASAIFEASKYQFVEELPEEIGRLVKVKKFTATNNFRLYKIPESLADLHERLEHLDLSYNNLQEFPLAICRLRYLTRLDINNNQIKCLPAKVDQLKSLETCYMDSNFLMAVPSTMTFLRNMKHFYIENNPLLKEEDKESAMMDCPYDPSITACGVTGEPLGETVYHFVNFVDFAGNRRMPVHFVCASEKARDLAIEEKDAERVDFWKLKY